MYAGRKVEEATGRRNCSPGRCIPTCAACSARSRAVRRGRGRRGCTEIPGMVPPLQRPAAGCAFAPRCALADATLPRRVSAVRSEAAGPLRRLLADAVRREHGAGDRGRRT